MDNADHHAELSIQKRLCPGNTKPCRKCTVVRARRSASLCMARDGDAHLVAGLRKDLVCQLIGNRRIMVAFHLLLVFFLGKLQVIRTDRAFRDGQNRETLS